jgi:hypothetical protein
MWREFASPAVDVLIANAGINRPGHLVDVTEDDYDAVLDTNVKGVFLLLKQVLPGMIDRGSGQVVVTNSVLGLKPAVNSSLYCASKFALDGLVKSCREEVRQHGIKVGQVRHASRGIERERERERGRAWWSCRWDVGLTRVVSERSCGAASGGTTPSTRSIPEETDSKPCERNAARCFLPASRHLGGTTWLEVAPPSSQTRPSSSQQTTWLPASSCWSTRVREATSIRSCCGPPCGGNPTPAPGRCTSSVTGCEADRTREARYSEKVANRHVRVWRGATEMVLERWTNPKLSRRTCACDLQPRRGNSDRRGTRLLPNSQPAPKRSAQDA